MTPFTRQTLFFSATMAPEIERITNTFLSAPARVEVARQASASETIEQGVVMFKGSRRDREGTEKRNVLRKLIELEGDKCTNAIIFCNRKTDVDICAKSLKKYGLDAAPIHGDLDQSQRTKTLDQFREGGLRFLVASDVAARGLDVPSVSHVFNYDVPSHAEDYVHRIGRTGRAGREGKAMMICGPKDEKNFAAIEALLQKEIPRIDNPIAKTVEATPAKDEAAAPSEKPKRTRTRRSSKPKEETAPVVAASVETSAVEAAPAVEAKPEPVKAAPAPEPVAETQPEGNRNRRGGKNNNGGRGRQDDRNKVVGMGDHMPGFIAMSFEERRAS